MCPMIKLNNTKVWYTHSNYFGNNLTYLCMHPNQLINDPLRERSRLTMNSTSPLAQGDPSL